MQRLTNSTWIFCLSWLVAKLISPVILGLVVQVAVHDVNYYFNSINDMLAGKPVQQTLVEYPLPVLPLLEVPWLLGGHTEGAYRWIFVALIVATDALFCYLLWRECRSSGDGLAPLWWWLGFSAVLSPLAYVRFDMWTAVLAAVAVLLWFTRPRVVGALVALGAGIKLWPALLWLPSLGQPKVRNRAAVGFGITGLALALSCLAWAGWGRLVSPLTWQSDRGLQVESIPATLPMLARALAPSQYRLGVSRYNAFEIEGPGVAASMVLAQVLTVAGVLAIIAVVVLWWRSACRDEPVAVALVAIFITLIMIVTNKTFSPQYLVWLGPLTALTVLWRVQGTAGQRLWQLQALLIMTAVMTTLIFPTFYSTLMFWTNPLGGAALTGLLVIRNVAMFAALVLCAAALRSLHQQKLVNCR